MRRLAYIACILASAVGFAQLASDTTKGVVLGTVAEPIYPPLARQARITGTVNVDIRVRQDGGVASAAVASGHPMLKEAALNSARQSRFECHGCTAVLTPYSLAYAFRLIGPDCSKTNREQSVDVDLIHSQVTVTATAPAICLPAGQLQKVRSAKCLYLWKCGVRYPL